MNTTSPSPASAIEARYELSPTQRGMLYDTLASDAPGTYSTQVRYVVRGPLEPPAFFAAWEELIARHAVLRTTVHWEGLPEPEQRVHTSGELGRLELDWSELAEDEQRSRLETFLEAELARGFDLTRLPLLRVSVIRLGPESHVFVLDHHHLLLDGWCKALLFEELFAHYEGRLAGRPVRLDPPPPYRRYIEWLREQDLGDAERFWRRELEGVGEPTPLWPDLPPPGDDVVGRHTEERFELSPEETAALGTFCRERRLTPNTVLQGAWALALADGSQRDDVVFGATVSGRPPGLDGVEAMMGLFINTIPVRLRIVREATVLDWMQEAQLRHARARDHEHAPLSRIQQWSSVAGGQRVFDSIVVFENTIGYRDQWSRYGNIELGDAHAVSRNGFSLTLRAVPTRTLRCQLLYDTGDFTTESARRIAALVRACLNRLPESAEGSVGALLERLTEDRSAYDAGRAEAAKGAMASRLRSVRRARPVRPRT